MHTPRPPRRPVRLWPPLAYIESRFGGVAPAAPAPELDEFAVAHADVPDVESLLADGVRRREAVRQAGFAKVARPGTLLRIPVPGGVRGVLLDLPVAGERWRGWLLAFEADYAGAADVLLEPDDEPYDPAFGMVQTWNALEFALPAQYEVAGLLSANRLAAVRSVADAWAACGGDESAMMPEVDAEPGRVGLRETAGGMAVLTGTPLDPQPGAQDPRVAYRRIYDEAAKALRNVPAAARPEARWRRSAAPRWWWVGAPALALVGGVLIGQQVLRLPGAGDTVAYRTAASAERGERVIVARFHGSTSLDTLHALLRAQHAVLVDGPDAAGEYWIDAADPERALAAILASPATLAAELRQW